MNMWRTEARGNTILILIPMNDDRHYNEQEAEEILKLAAREASAGGMSRQKLLETAAELGISPETVSRAEEQVRLKREVERNEEEDRELRKQFIAEQRSNFVKDFWSYIGVNAGLVGIWFMTGSSYFWPAWVLICWGMGLLVDFFTTYLSKDEAKYQRWRRRRFRKSMSGKQMIAKSKPLLEEMITSGEVTKLDAVRELRQRLSLDSRDAQDIADLYEKENPGVFT